jgi:adenylate kinase family enzyme
MDGQEMTFDEQVVLLLALMPHISPQTLDPLFLQNKNLDRPYTEFGGWRGSSHTGFLPTGETAAFLLAHDNPDKRLDVIRLFERDHWFHTKNILHLEGQGEGEPFLSGRLIVSEEIIARLHGQKYEPEYNAEFPAKKITTVLDWNDLVLPYNLLEELDDIVCWIKHQQEIRQDKQLNRIIKQGYRCLFYGPPGTGKTLTATLLGKQNEMDVYRIDLSMIVSKYIGETEKNLAKIFDKAEHQNWILFFDEADALFGQRTETQSSNDRHANQEVAYLLQRIEDFPGIVILATNLKENIDEAFFRRFQSALYFPMPDQRLRHQLWKQTIPLEWVNNQNEEKILLQASEFELSGGSMVNIIQYCAIKLYGSSDKQLTIELLKKAVNRELEKEGKIIS